MQSADGSTPSALIALSPEQAGSSSSRPPHSVDERAVSMTSPPLPPVIDVSTPPPPPVRPHDAAATAVAMPASFSLGDLPAASASVASPASASSPAALLPRHPSSSPSSTFAPPESPSSAGRLKNPRWTFFALMVVYMNEAIAITMLYPYAGLLVVHLDPNLSRADAGKLSGLVAGAFQVAQAIFASRWGRTSDKVGRRPMLALGLIGSAIFALCFGLSTEVWQLLLFRFLYGVANGNAPIVKTMVPEISTPATEAMAWSVMSAGWSFGSTIGPAIGGLLYDPASNMDAFKGTIFESRPALLPSLVGAIYAMVALCFTACVLPETNHRAKTPRWMEQMTDCGCIPMYRAPTQNDDREAPSTGSNTAAQTPTASSGSAVVSVPGSHERKSSYGLSRMIRDKRMSIVLGAYIMLAWNNTTFNEVFPLLAILPVSQGGLGVNASVIGLIFTCFALVGIVGDLSFATMSRVHGRAKTLKIGLTVTAVFTLLHAALPAINFHGSIPAIVAATVAMSLPRLWTTSWSFSSLLVGMAACAPREHLGAATGISHSCGNLSRAIIPPLATWLFAWSVGSSSGEGGEAGSTAAPGTDEPQSFFGPGFPVNRWLVFATLAGCLLLVAYIIRRLAEDNFTRLEHSTGATTEFTTLHPTSAAEAEIECEMSPLPTAPKADPLLVSPLPPDVLRAPELAWEEMDMSPPISAFGSARTLPGSPLVPRSGHGSVRTIPGSPLMPPTAHDGPLASG
jgi:MFS family permease